jgi:hypothetical protein
MYNHPDFKVSTDDKKEGLTIWQRTSAEGLNVMKASGEINRRPFDIFKVIGNGVYRT